ELTRALVEYRDAGDVAGQQIVRELDASEREIERARQGLRERRLADAWNVLQEQMARRSERRERQLDDFLLSAQRARDVRVQRLGQLRRLGGRKARQQCRVLSAAERLQRCGAVRRSHGGRLTHGPRSPLDFEVCDSAPPWWARCQV